MASHKQLANLRKCKNKNKHKWVDIGKRDEGTPSYIYVCQKCNKEKMKLDAYSASYFDENGNPLGYLAPECIEKKD